MTNGLEKDYVSCSRHIRDNRDFHYAENYVWFILGL